MYLKIIIIAKTIINAEINIRRLLCFDAAVDNRAPTAANVTAPA